MWTTFASIMTARTWSKFGNKSTRPDALTSRLSTTTPIQNHTFSPALNLPDGTCPPEIIPPRFANHLKS